MGVCMRECVRVCVGVRVRVCEAACEWVTRHLTKVRNDNKWQELVGFAVRMWASLRIGMEYIHIYV